MKILESFIFTVTELENNLELISYLYELKDGYIYDRLSLIYIYKTDSGVFLKRPEMIVKKVHFVEMLVEITNHLGEFKIE